MIQLKILRENGDVRFKAYGTEIDEHFHGEYEPHDRIRIESDDEFVMMQLDATLAESLVYIPDRTFEFEIPFDYERRACYAPGAFAGDDHRLRVYEPTDAEVYETERCLSLNAHDRHKVPKYFPHATANFVTREDPCFFERNAIDGVTDNLGHGLYPYHSWGGGLREDLEFEIHFGREIETDRTVIHLRADFPHDTYWKEAELEFSDGTRVKAQFEKSAEGQTVTYPKIKTELVRLTGLKQMRLEDGSLSFAALSQMSVYGNHIKKENKGMEVRDAANAKDVRFYTTDRLREEFHINNLFLQ